jgi:hypothetical protein
MGPQLVHHVNSLRCEFDGFGHAVPIGDLAPLKIVAETRFSDTERAAINGGLARRLFGL